MRKKANAISTAVLRYHQNQSQQHKERSLGPPAPSGTSRTSFVFAWLSGPEFSGRVRIYGRVRRVVHISVYVAVTFVIGTQAPIALQAQLS
jgi:hypothetical protein